MYDLLKFYTASKHVERVIIVDDASTIEPDYEAFVEYFRTATFKITILINSYNFGGPALSRNRGLAEVEAIDGKGCIFLDPDDFLPPGYVSMICDTFEENNEIGLISSRVKSKSENHNLKISNYTWNSSLSRMSLSDFAYYNPLILSGTALNLASGFKFPRFREETKLIAVEDYQFYLDCLRNEISVFSTSIPIVFYGLTGENLSKSKLKMAVKFSRVNIAEFKVHFFLVRFIVYLFRGIFMHFLLKLRQVRRMR